MAEDFEEITMGPNTFSSMDLPEVIINISTIVKNIARDDVGKKDIPEEIWTGRVRIYGIGGSVIAIFGLIGNAVSINVLSRYDRKSSAPLLLTILALFDLLVLGSELIVETLTLLSTMEYISPSHAQSLYPQYLYFFTLPLIGQTGTTFMTVLITIERYIAVVKPFLAPRLCKKSIALKASAAIFVWSIVYHIPRYLAYDNFDTWQNETNSTKVVFDRTEFGKGVFYNEVFIWINFILEFLLPCTILVVLNTLMIRALRESRKLELRSLQHNRKKNKHHLTAMVLSVTTLFFFCELFSALSFIIVRRLKKYHECSLACNNFIALADTMIIVNSASNFILYCAVGKKFRDLFLESYCGCWGFRQKLQRSCRDNPIPLCNSGKSQDSADADSAEES